MYYSYVLQSTDEEIKKRFEAHYGDSQDFIEGRIPYLREKLSSLSEFLREIKVGFARFYSRRHNIWPWRAQFGHSPV